MFHLTRVLSAGRTSCRLATSTARGQVLADWNAEHFSSRAALSRSIHVIGAIVMRYCLTRAIQRVLTRFSGQPASVRVSFKSKGTARVPLPFDETSVCAVRNDASAVFGVKAPTNFNLRLAGNATPLPLDAALSNVVDVNSDPVLELVLCANPAIALVQAVREAIGDDMLMVAQSERVHRPYFFTNDQFQAIQSFVDRNRSAAPSLLMLAGTIKSGKSTVLNHILRGMVCARFLRQPDLPTPVFLSHTFTPAASSPLAAANQLAYAAAYLAEGLGIKFRDSAPDHDLQSLPDRLASLSEAIEQHNGELWVLLDEVQAPLVASSPEQSQLFTAALKRIVELFSERGHIVVTGSGMFTLMDSVRTHHVNGFSLWDAAAKVSLGTSPTPNTAVAMAKRLIATIAPSLPVSAEQLVFDLSESGRAPGLTSSRPALVAYLLERCSVAAPTIARYDEAWEHLIRKLTVESTRDTARGLTYMTPAERRTLLAVAEDRGIKQHAEFHHDITGIFGMIKVLGETPPPGKLLGPLQPPYAWLVQSWILPDGDLAIQLKRDKISLPDQTTLMLQFLADNRQGISDEVKEEISTAVLKSLAQEGVGILRQGGGSLLPPTDPPDWAPEGKGRQVTAPQSVAEIPQVPAFRDLLACLSSRGTSPAEHRLRAAQRAESTQYLRCFGFEVLLWIRHWRAHATSTYQPSQFQTPYPSFSDRVIELIVRSATACLTRSGAVAFDEHGVPFLTASPQKPTCKQDINELEASK